MLRDRDFRAIAEQCPMGIIIQRDERVVYVNRAGRGWLELESAETFDLPLAGFMDPSSYSPLLPNLRRLGPVDDQLFMGALVLRSRSGRLINAEVHHEALAGADAGATMLTFNDVTVSRRLEMEGHHLHRPAARRGQRRGVNRP